MIGALRELSEKGAEFQAAVAERTKAAVRRIREQHQQLLKDQEQAVTGARATVATLREGLNRAAAAAQVAEQALVGGEARRRQADEQLAQAAAKAAAVRRELDALTTGLIPSPGPDRQRDTELDVLGGLTTPSDYLEKIFQIPLWLRPLPPERRAPLAATLLGRDFDGSDPGDDNAGLVVDPAPRDRLDDGRTEAENDEDAAGTEGDMHAPPEVRITAGEMEFLQTRVAPLLDGNARALKRFVNTYHLVKAALSEVELDAFAPPSGSDDARQDSYRVCMAQLALLATDRRRAQLLANLIDEASHSKESPPTLSAWLDGLAKQKDEGVRSIAVDLRTVLIPPLEKLRVDRFASWFERTRRYSFYL